MFKWLNRRNLSRWLSALTVAAVGMGALAATATPASAQVQPLPLPMVVALNTGWTNFTWLPAVQGPLSFSTIFISPDNTANLTLPALLTFTTSAQVNCPATGGNVLVHVQVYDFSQLILSMPYSVSCAPRAVPWDPTLIRTAYDYVTDPHFLKFSVPIANGGAHSLTVTTDLATQDSFYWGYVRTDTAVGVPPPAASRGAIAVSASSAPATAWADVQWGDPNGTVWNNIASWLGPLSQTNGKMAFWVNPAQYGTGPYRWVIYTKDPAQGGTVWGVSDPFMFPRSSLDWVWMTVGPADAPVQ